MSKTEFSKYGSTTKTREPIKITRPDDTKPRFKDSDFTMKTPPPPPPKKKG